jgi:preprotein translocase subunit SecB
MSTPSQSSQHEFAIQRIYTKDVSYEAPNTPDVFLTEWTPKVELNLQTEAKKMADDSHEVVLHVTVTVKLKDKIAFLVEVKQAGVFTIKGFPEEHLGPMVGSFCPNIIFPYAREIISETICRGGFPPLYLAPVNFDAFYEEQLKQGKK